MELNSNERKLINQWQRGFPLTPQPYAQIASDMGLGEDEIITMLDGLKQRGILSRIGAVVRPNVVGASSLVAMAVEPEELKNVAQIVSEQAQVNHNYEREDELNLWFVVTASDNLDLDEVLARIERQTGYQTVKLPLETAYHIDLGFTI